MSLWLVEQQATGYALILKGFNHKVVRFDCVVFNNCRCSDSFLQAASIWGGLFLAM